MPGLAGAKFAPGSTSSFRLDRVFVSPDGSCYILSTLTNLPTSKDQPVIVGTFGGSATVVAREGTPMPAGTIAGTNFAFIRTHMGTNDAGDFAFSSDTSAPARTAYRALRIRLAGRCGSTLSCDTPRGTPCKFCSKCQATR